MASEWRQVDHAAEDTRLWLRQLEADLPFPDNRLAYPVLRGVLHALRDRLPVVEAAQLGAQLPNLVRGIYYDGWHPGRSASRLRSMLEFVEAVMAAMAPASLNMPERAVKAALGLISRHVSPGEINDVLSCLPEDVRRQWPLARAEETA